MYNQKEREILREGTGENPTVNGLSLWNWRAVYLKVRTNSEWVCLPLSKVLSTGFSSIQLPQSMRLDEMHGIGSPEGRVCPGEDPVLMLVQLGS